LILVNSPLHLLLIRSPLWSDHDREAEHLSALGAYERLWEPAATDAQIDAVFAPGFKDHRPGAADTGVDGFREQVTTPASPGRCTPLTTFSTARSGRT
jgi:hypothetical protein